MSCAMIQGGGIYRRRGRDGRNWAIGSERMGGGPRKGRASDIQRAGKVERVAIRPKKKGVPAKIKSLTNDNRTKDSIRTKEWQGTGSSGCVAAVSACLYGTDGLKTRSKTVERKR